MHAHVAGAAHSVAVGEDTVTTWGSNRNSQRGLLESRGASVVCVCVCVCMCISVAIGDDTVTTWGSNRNSQRGLLEVRGACACVCARVRVCYNW